MLNCERLQWIRKYDHFDLSETQLTTNQLQNTYYRLYRQMHVEHE